MFIFLILFAHLVLHLIIMMQYTEFKRYYIEKND